MIIYSTFFASVLYQFFRPSWALFVPDYVRFHFVSAGRSAFHEAQAKSITHNLYLCRSKKSKLCVFVYFFVLPRNKRKAGQGCRYQDEMNSTVECWRHWRRGFSSHLSHHEISVGVSTKIDVEIYGIFRAKNRKCDEKGEKFLLLCQLNPWRSFETTHKEPNLSSSAKRIKLISTYPAHSALLYWHCEAFSPRFPFGILREFKSLPESFVLLSRKKFSLRSRCRKLYLWRERATMLQQSVQSSRK